MINNLLALINSENIYLLANWGVIPFWIFNHKERANLIKDPPFGNSKINYYELTLAFDKP